MVLSSLVCSSLLAGVDQSDVTFYTGACDASAAAPLDDSRIVIASDEASLTKQEGKEGPNQLLIYRRSHAKPVAKVTIKQASQDDPEHPEADIEGAARVGDRIFWLASHGLNSSGKVRKNRLRLFATDVKHGKLKLVHFQYQRLLEDLDSAPATRSLGLKALYDSGKPPEKGGVNVEGLAEGRSPGELLIAFRSPLFHGKGLLVPLLNVEELLSKNPPKGKFGTPIPLDLGEDRGFRDIVRRAEYNDYVIVAGPAESRGPSFQLFLWNGNPSSSPQAVAEQGIPANFFPESLVVLPRSTKIELLSDDGDCVFTDGGTPECIVPPVEDEEKGNKHLPSRKRRFRAILLDLGNPH